MNNALLYLGGLLVVVFAALFAVPLFVDWNGYRGVFEEEASKVLGRDVRVGGAVNVRFLPTPYVRFEKVRLADPTGQTGEPFIRAESFTMRLAGPPLLRGVLEANEIELNKPVLTLALDDNGGGNWSSVQIKPGALPFVPQDVTLRSVRFIDGAVALYSSGAQPIARFDAINGEMSAEALKGPFKFKGQATWSAEQRDVKFATTALDPNGSFQFKATTRSAKSSTSYFLDGKVEDFSGKPRLTGELTGKIALPNNEPAATQAGTTDAPSMELKSKIDADTSGAKVDDITLTLDNAAEPQVITGSATSTWGKAQRLDIALAAKWLDIDRLASAGDGTATFTRVKQLGMSLLHSLAGDGAAGAKIDIEQIKLGGETAGGLAIDAERLGGAVKLRHLKAGLPGGSRLDLTGDLKDDGGKVSFAGNGFVHGTNIAGLLAWASKSGAVIDVRAEGPYSAEGRVLIDDQRFELTEASADVGGRSLSGDIVVSGDQRRRVAVTLEAARLDSRELFPATARALDASIRRAFGQPTSNATSVSIAEPPNTSKPTADAANDISLRILTGELKHGEQTFKNVDATIGLENGNIRIPSAKFTTASGLVAGVEAFIKSADQEPKGTLAYDVSATTPDALKDLLNVFELSTLVSSERLAVMGPAKFSGIVLLGERSKTSADVSAAGTLQATKISAHAEFDGGLPVWRTAPSRIQVVGKASQLDALLASFGVARSGSADAADQDAEFLFASSGAVASNLTTLLDIKAPGMDVAFRGRTALPSDGPAGIDGVMNVKSNDARDVMAIAGLPEPGGFANTIVDGSLSIKRNGGTWTVATQGVSAGDSIISGNASLNAQANGSPTLAGDLRVTKLTVAGLTSAVVDSTQLGGVNQATENVSVWPDARFNFDALKNVQGELRVKFDTLRIGNGLFVQSGALKFSVAPDQLAFTEITGMAAKGALAASVTLTKAAAGTAVDIQLKINGADLARLGVRSRGKATLEATAQGLALSPASVMAMLNGSGSLTLDTVRLAVPAPGTVSAIVADVISTKLPNDADVLTTALQTAVGAADTDLGSRTLPLVISNGIGKLDPVLIDAADGKVTGTTHVDLTTLALDSTWQVAGVVQPLPPPAKPLPGWVAPAPKGQLPPVAIVFTGPLGDSQQLTAAISVADMQRELVVRQTERNIEILERIKLEDAERARMELERRKAAEADRAAAAAAKAAGLPPPPPTVVLPPVIPESAGTAPPVADPTSVSSQPQTGAASQAHPANATGTVTTRTIDLAPVVERPTVPASGPSPAVRPQPARATPPRQPPPRRTTSDEVMRSLGGFP